MMCCQLSLADDYSIVVSPAVGEEGRIYWCLAAAALKWRRRWQAEETRSLLSWLFSQTSEIPFAQ